MREEWRGVFGFPLYRVSSRGRVLSLQYGKEKILKTPPMRNGYPQVWLCMGGPKKKFYLHRLIWETFHGPVHNGLEINHKDGNKANAHINNLELVTTKGNARHARAMGLLRIGEQIAWAKLKRKEVFKIKKLYASGEYTQKVLAQNFDVSQTLISAIVRNKIWQSNLKHDSKKKFFPS